MDVNDDVEHIYIHSAQDSLARQQSAHRPTVHRSCPFAVRRAPHTTHRCLTSYSQQTPWRGVGHLFTHTTLEGRAGTDTGQHAPRRTRHTTRSPSVTVPTDKTQNRPSSAARGHARQSGRQGGAGHTRARRANPPLSRRRRARRRRRAARGSATWPRAPPRARPGAPPPPPPRRARCRRTRNAPAARACGRRAPPS